MLMNALWLIVLFIRYFEHREDAWLVVWLLISRRFLFFKLLESVGSTFHFFVFLVFRFVSSYVRTCVEVSEVNGMVTVSSNFLLSS